MSIYWSRDQCIDISSLRWCFPILWTVTCYRRIQKYSKDSFNNAKKIIWLLPKKQKNPKRFQGHLQRCNENNVATSRKDLLKLPKCFPIKWIETCYRRIPKDTKDSFKDAKKTMWMLPKHLLREATEIKNIKYLLSRTFLDRHFNIFRIWFESITLRCRVGW